jgi:hypothetical protein
MPIVAGRAHSPPDPAGLRRARPLLNEAAMRLFDSLWEPLAVTVLGVVLFVASF